LDGTSVVVQERLRQVVGAELDSIIFHDTLELQKCLYLVLSAPQVTHQASVCCHMSELVSNKRKSWEKLTTADHTTTLMHPPEEPSQTCWNSTTGLALARVDGWMNE
jgi:hypothetical protein